MLRGGKHGQHGHAIAVGVALSSAEDAPAVLPQDLQAVIAMGAKSRGRVQIPDSAARPVATISVEKGHQNLFTSAGQGAPDI
jgi:hypothetical protein